VSDQPPQERRAQAANPVDVLDPGRCCHKGEQAVELATDQDMLAGEAGHGLGQSRRGLEEILVAPARTFRDIDVCTEVAGELHQSSLDTLTHLWVLVTFSPWVFLTTREGLQRFPRSV